MISFVDLARIGLVLSLVYTIGHVIYNLFFHPLREFPGDLLSRASFWPRVWYQINGRMAFHVRDLHKQYGPVVRIAPDELVFSSPQAWQDIYGHKKSGELELPKLHAFYRMFDHIPPSILSSNRQEHSVLRRQLSHGFSDRSMHEQEPIIGSYVKLLISRLKTETKKNPIQNVRDWYNWTTFDLIGDLSFGVEGGFGSLEKLETHRWVELLAITSNQNCRVRGLCRLGLNFIMEWCSKLDLLKDSTQRDLVYEKVGQRIQSGSRPDFLEALINKQDQLGLTQGHLAMNATILVFAGSETTATLLSGATYFLTSKPHILRRLEQEVRSSFKSDEEITLTSVSRLSYMLACLNESLRCYPPVPSGMPREVPRGGTVIDGNYVAPGTIVSIFQWAVNHDERLWTEPDSFEPGRWMGDLKFQSDQLDAMQPFSVGPRNCIGKNLAYAEMRLILAKIIYNFDISMVTEDSEWLSRQKAYDFFWEAEAVNIRLKPIERSNEIKG
ncbi:putative cytochrome P450 monooxygenase [Xylaria nigripes]|nr:putative cytochrome P450 monooxygenase [Xylaria nigripes]